MNIAELVDFVNADIARGVSAPIALAALETHLVNRELAFISEVAVKLAEMKIELQAGIRAALLECFDRLRKTIALNRGQTADVLANSVLAHLDEESRE